MATTKISGLAEQTTPAGTDVLPIDDGANAKKITLLNLTGAVKAKGNIHMSFYTELGQIGCTKSSTLQQVVEAMPQNSFLGIWINAEFTSIWKEVLAGIGQTDAYGILEIHRVGFVWTLKFNLYDATTVNACRFTKINGDKWTRWVKELTSDI